MSTSDIQSFLRFLTKDAKVSLATALAKVPELQKSKLDSPESIAKAKVQELASFFPDEKVAKQVFNAAKRVSKKRGAGEADASASPSTKRKRKDPFEIPGSVPGDEVERSLELRSSPLAETELEDQVFITNRAPLVLAFAATLVKYTMPEQPPSSRLSLAQAVVSMGSQSKAKYIGLKTGPTAEDEGWAEGQPTVTVMNRQISVLKRWGYSWSATPSAPEEHNEASGKPIKAEPHVKVELSGEADVETGQQPDQQTALWAIDLDALKKLNGPITFNTTASSDTSGLPVYSPQAARAYLYRSFDSPVFTAADADTAAEVKAEKKSKKTAAASANEREENISRLLRALNILFDSWAPHLSTSELDRRAWSWYVTVRPDVEHGIAGWGAKGELRLKDILDLRRKG